MVITAQAPSSPADHLPKDHLALSSQVAPLPLEQETTVNRHRARQVPAPVEEQATATATATAMAMAVTNLCILPQLQLHSLSQPLARQQGQVEAGQVLVGRHRGLAVPACIVLLEVAMVGTLVVMVLQCMAPALDLVLMLASVPGAEDLRMAWVPVMELALVLHLIGHLPPLSPLWRLPVHLFLRPFLRPFPRSSRPRTTDLFSQLSRQRRSA